MARNGLKPPASHKLDKLKELLEIPGDMGVVPVYDSLMRHVGEKRLWRQFLNRPQRRKLARRLNRWERENGLVAA